MVGPTTVEHERFARSVWRSAAVAGCSWTVVLAVVGWWVLVRPVPLAPAACVLLVGATWLSGVVVIVLGSMGVLRRHRRLALQEALHRALWEQGRDAVFVLEGGVFTACNPAAETLFGASLERIVGSSPWEFSPPYQPDGRDSREAAIRYLRAAESGETVFFEWLHRREDGTVFPVEVRLSRLVVGERVFVLASVRDLTEHRRIEQRRRLLERAVEQAAENVMVTDARGTILYVNPAFEATTGYRFDEVIGRHPSILSSGQHEAAFFREMWSTISAGKVWRGTLVNRRKNGDLYHEEIVISPVTDERGTVTAFVSVGRDVTRELELEKRIKLAERMETVGQMASVVAHDFNNLLMAVQGAAHVIGMRAGDDPRVEDRIRAIRHAVEKGAELIQRLLAVSKRQLTEPRDVDLRRTLADMRPTIAAALREDILLEMHLPDSGAVVHVDPGQFEQVVLNLVANGRDAMPQGGRLTVELDEVTLDEEAVAAKPWTREGRFVRLAVGDTGVGMDVATIARIFEPFFTTKGERGTGLGLATVYGIVERAGGFINVYSEEGKGSVFKVYLPLVEGGASPLEEPALADPEPVPTGTETVLLVEDDEGVREGIRDMLVELGYSVIEAADGLGALRILEERPLAVDVVLTDIVIPGIDGGELAERAGTIAPHARFVFTSGYTENVVHHRFVKRDQTAYLEKPFTFAQLGRAVREVLDSRP